MSYRFFTSEAVAAGHPDKVADQIADAILDACLVQDLFSRVACEVMVTKGIVVLAGEISTLAEVNYETVVRSVIKEIGYTGFDGFAHDSCGIISMLRPQAIEIGNAVSASETFANPSAGDQGTMFGYAVNETESLMPLPHVLANQLLSAVTSTRMSKALPYLRPDGKSQVTVEYDLHGIPKRVDAIVLSVQHTAEVAKEKLHADMKTLIQKTIPSALLDSKTKLYINPSGSFVQGGPGADCGLTGRKSIADTYGGAGHCGGGSFSGKDATKVDRSAAYAARHIAKHIVAGGFAKKCEVALSYAIGLADPVAVAVDTFGTSEVSEELLTAAIKETFKLSVAGIIDSLSLRKPVYLETASGGHFGREGVGFTWEKLDKLATLRDCVGQLKKRMR